MKTIELILATILIQLCCVVFAADTTTSSASTEKGAFNFVRLITAEDGLTTFVDDALPLNLLDFAPPAPPNQISTHMDATKVTFGKLPPEWFGDWHPTPRKQYIVLIQGAFEIETSDGSKRIFRAGSTMLLEDVDGKGHATRVIGDEDVHYIAVAVP